MKINNILVVSPMYKELKRVIEKELLHKNFRYMTENEVIEDDFTWADALVGFNFKFDHDFGKVKWVHSLGAGVDRFLHKKRWNEEILLTRTICSFGQRIAEYCLSYILMDLQFHNQFDRLKRQKQWEPMTPTLLSEQKLLVYGTGEIGQTVAKVFSAVGVEVYGVSLSGKEKDGFKEVMTLDSHTTRLDEMNYVINTLPLTVQTEHLFNDHFFKYCSNAGFLNVGRGASVDESALLKALDLQQVRFAVLDVFTQEPLPKEHPFWSHPNIVITPHISAVTTPREGIACFIDTLKNLEENKPLENKVDIKKGY